MGLLSKLVLAPLAPVYGVVALAQKLEQLADDELYGEPALRRQLVELQRALDDGRLDEASYDAEEAVLLERLELARRRRDEAAAR